jgi:hypothetical protein
MTVKQSLAIFFLLFFSTVSLVSARLGVGVATGKIQVEERLKPGQIYVLPPLTIVNTGDEESDYKVVISYHEGQQELRPAKEWLAFSPKSFHLKPGISQLVEIKLHLPLKVEPGDYFVYLEGQPDEKDQAGQTKVGIAAAAKLYFTVEPANLWWGAYYKLVSFWSVYEPWPQRVSYVIIGIGVILILRRFLNVQINVKKPVKKSGENKGE